MSDLDTYVTGVVAKHTPIILYDVSERVISLEPHIRTWANGHLYEVRLSGSFAKGTAITETTDIDIFISLNPTVSTCNTLEQVYTTLRDRFTLSGHAAREQNVSIGITHTGLKIDVVAGVQQHVLSTDHSVWKRKAQTWTKTNIDEHVKYVRESGRVADIKAVKIWRKLRGLDFPSFYLELVVIEALKGRPRLVATPAENFVAVMSYLSLEFLTKKINDPANGANVLSDELTQVEKQAIQRAAAVTLRGSWEEAIW